MKCLVAVALFHKAKGRSHGDIQPQTVLINERLEIVCTNNYPLFPGGHHLLTKVRHDPEYFGPLAPEDLASGTVLDEFASEVWSIGVTALCYAARKPLTEFYDFEQMTLRPWSIEECLRQLSQACHYSPSLLHALTSMLHQDPKHRAKAEQIQAILDMYDDEDEEESGSHLESLRLSVIIPQQHFALDSPVALSPRDWSSPQAFSKAPESLSSQLFSKIRDEHHVQTGDFGFAEPQAASDIRAPILSTNPLNSKLNFKPSAAIEPVPPQRSKPGVVFLPEKLQTKPKLPKEPSNLLSQASQLTNSKPLLPVLVSNKNISFVLKVPQEHSFRVPGRQTAVEQPAKTRPLPRTRSDSNHFEPNNFYSAEYPHEREHHQPQTADSDLINWPATES